MEIFEIGSKLAKYWHFGIVGQDGGHPKVSEFRLRLIDRLSYTVDL